MLRLALKLLYGDRAKYAMLVGGLTFCALLMTQQISVFFWVDAVDDRDLAKYSGGGLGGGCQGRAGERGGGDAGD